MLKQALSGRSGMPIRYRIAGEQHWRAGETVELNGSELMFLCDVPLELHDDVEVILQTKVQGMGRDSAMKLLCTGRVLRRFLANWPEVRLALVVGLNICQIATGPGDADAA